MKIHMRGRIVNLVQGRHTRLEGDKPTNGPVVNFVIEDGDADKLPAESGRTAGWNGQLGLFVVDTVLASMLADIWDEFCGNPDVSAEHPEVLIQLTIKHPAER